VTDIDLVRREEDQYILPDCSEDETRKRKNNLHYCWANTQLGLVMITANERRGKEMTRTSEMVALEDLWVRIKNLSQYQSN
jgi:uncharacterized protein YhbP (UPF0306 family)